MDSILNKVFKSNFGYDIIHEIEPEHKIFVSCCFQVFSLLKVKIYTKSAF